MNSKELVLTAYPTASIYPYTNRSRRAYVVRDTRGQCGRGTSIYVTNKDCYTEEDAWNDAAKAVEIEMIERLS